MKFKITLENLEPIRNQTGFKRELEKTISGHTLRGALVNAYLLYQCPYSSSWCAEKECDKFETCPVPNSLLYPTSSDSNVSFAHYACPKCDNILVRSPSIIKYCKHCHRRDGNKNKDLLVSDNYHGLTSCDVCKGYTLQDYDGLICISASCDFKTEEIPYVSIATGIGVNPKTGSVEEKMLFTNPIIIPGHQLIFFIETENRHTIHFIQNLSEKVLRIGGGRSRGYGSCRVKKVVEVQSKDEPTTNHFLVITPLFHSDIAENSGFPDIINSRGKISYYSGWSQLDENPIKQLRPVIDPGCTLKLSEPINLDSLELTGTSNGFGQLIPVESITNWINGGTKQNE